MEVICDLHIHSRYSGGSSYKITLPKIANNCRIKGINLIGSGDALNPLWLKELKNYLQEFADGVYFYPNIPEVKFIIQTEVELIWNFKKQIKKIHFILLFPDFETLIQVIEYLNKYGNLREDGRPKIYLSAEDFILDIKRINFFIEIIPAHVLTPFFGILGSIPNFRSLKQAVGNGIHYINAVESGLSADPNLIRNISELNNMSIISNSDAHSTNFHRIGREATKLKISKLTYKSIINSIERNSIIKTYEFQPPEGKYFYDGHRPERHQNKREFSCHPNENVKICPICRKNITKGVLSRIYELKDQNSVLGKKVQYIIPLLHLFSILNGGTEYSKQNLSLYERIVISNGGEFNIWDGEIHLNNIPKKILNVIENIKAGKYTIIPGYDGIYGRLELENYRLLESF